ncbi:sensor histidine kinase [Pseudoalteromonas ruthenica]|uniref:C4-dicarboxylate transport sensor protein DctB n=1 Tax=Pseudoalteromonas ruthenica TaxID=151081 RepID=A0A5S3Z1H3_9GAMM|nr:ATP-binding protein [Pseudoalteromonas ruthenica]TMP85861.1 sensor histidine kinase [Pseudoalteromonas ruthenica]
MSNKLVVKLLVYSVVLVVAMVLTVQVTLQQQAQRAHQQARVQGAHLSDYIDRQFSRYQRIVDSLSRSKAVHQALDIKRAASQDTDRYLHDMQLASSASDVYLLNTSGTVVATSNWHLPYSYKGNNFAFRGYFRDAMRHHSAIDFAQGQRSRKRGFYFSQAVIVAGEVAGVIVVKVNASQFEADKAALDSVQDTLFALVDENHVVLMSNAEPWRLTALSPMTTPQRQQLKQSQQFLERTIAPAPWQWQGQAQVYIAKRKRTFVIDDTALARAPYQLLTLVPRNYLNETLVARLGVTLMCLLVLIALVEYLLVKVAGYRQLLYSERSLAEQVKQRSQELEQAQDALVRTAKLATIGQLSASVNHEINQPLSAMSAYIAASKRLIARGQYDKALSNLQLIEQLVNRVHAIAAQLKSFSQKREHKMQATSLAQTIDNALLVAGPQLKEYGVEVCYHPPNVTVWVDPYQFEQVLVNLFANACQAMEKQAVKRLRIEADSDDENVYLSIIDTGSGIEHHALSSIFEPFYTTKSEHGLGLGLSISKQIIESFQGTLSAHNHPDGGAEFLISLHQQEPQI